MIDYDSRVEVVPHSFKLCLIIAIFRSTKNIAPQADRQKAVTRSKETVKPLFSATDRGNGTR